MGNVSVVSTDGLKSSLLQRALIEYSERCDINDYFVTIGHPKSVTSCSLENLRKFIENNIAYHNFTTYKSVLTKIRKNDLV